MAGVLQRDEPASRAAPAPEARRDLDKARAFLLTGLAWAGVVVLSRRSHAERECAERSGTRTSTTGA
jgi:hypothetical protein